MNQLLATATVLLVVGTARWSDAPSIDELLPNLRAAAGAADVKVVAVAMSGKGEAYGEAVNTEVTFDREGRYFSAFGGAMPLQSGFDGKTAWIRDYANATRAVRLHQRDDQLLIAWVRTGYWLDPNAPVVVTVAEPDASDTDLLKLRVGLRDGTSKGTLLIDRGTMRPRRLVFETSGEETTVTFDDYRSVAGLMLPFQMRVEEKGGIPTIQRFETATTLETIDSDRFAFKPSAPSGVVFDASKQAALEVKRARTGHLLVKPKINGEDVGWFIFDSGAGIMCLDKKIADERDMPIIGKTRVNGSGGATTSHFRKISNVDLGPVALSDVVAIELALAPIGAALGERIAGIVGYQVFQACVVEVDMGAATVSLHDPAQYQLADAAEWNPLYVIGGLPCVPARFEGDREGIFRLDTGGSGTVLFHSDAVDQHKLLEGRKTTMGMIGGVGGISVTRRGPIDWFELGGHRFEKPVVEFSRANRGALQGEAIAGTIGQELLKPFQIVLWYQGERVAFVKSER